MNALRRKKGWDTSPADNSKATFSNSTGICSQLTQNGCFSSENVLRRHQKPRVSDSSGDIRKWSPCRQLLYAMHDRIHFEEDT